MPVNSSASSCNSAPCVLALQRVKSPAGPLEPAFLRELSAAFGLRYLVETGTFLGHTTAVASDIFPEVHTIELSPELAAKARTRFAGTPQVHVHQGDSATLLPQILEQLTGPALFWLDGHYSEGITARGHGNTPILDEIAAIVRSGRKDAVILIDDLRLFDRRRLDVGESSSLHGYPAVTEVYAAVQEIDPDYQFYVCGDVALAFPATPNVSVTPLILALTISRMFNGSNLPVGEVIAAESLVAGAEGVEREVLSELPAISAATEPHGLGLHYRLWHGQTLLGTKDFKGAKRQFLEVQRLGFTHWRIHWYLALANHGAGDNALARTILDALIEVVPDFAPARELRQKLAAPAAAIRPMLTPGHNALEQLVAARVYRSGQPLRLHLGCGEQHFDGYVNIDYPPSEHSCQTRIGADVFADITKLLFPPQSVDEIRLHHVFEHFKRAEALALLIRWHEALKVGGRLHIETPDLDGCARQLVSDLPFAVKQVVIRHCFGSQEAGWANHYDGWTAERYRHVLAQFGFGVQTKNWSWPHPPHLANVEAFATKIRSLSRTELLAAADGILSEYMTVDVPSERGMCDVWRKAMRDFLTAGEAIPTPSPVSGPELPCPVCRTAAPAAVARREQVYHQCPSCGCVFTPRIDAAVIETENSGNSVRHDQNQDIVRLQRLTEALGRRPLHLIDFGCGAGETTRFLQAQGLQTIGIDQTTPLQLKDVADGSVDGIMMVEVIEHLYDPHAIFQQFNRVLKAGGVAYIESSFVDGQKLAEWGYLEPAIGHCTVHSLRSMAFIAEKNGFTLQWLNANVCCLTKRAVVAPGVGNNVAGPAGNVVVKLQGGLGNQMFQFAAGLALARRNGAGLKLDLSFLRDRTPRPNFTQREYCLDLFQLPADCEVVADGSGFAKRLPCHVEQQFHFDPKFFDLGPGVYLDGYFQSPRFFEPVRAEVVRTFKSLVQPLNADQQALAGKIRACPAVCLNVRRGDYVANPVANEFHGVCDESYYQAATAAIRQQVPGAHFFIFSDDIEWCRTADLTSGASFTLVPHEFAGDRFGAYLQLMMACRHFILPNSSFGWWAAFLGDAPEKIVVAPTPWFDNPFNNTVDLLPAAWRRLPKNQAAVPRVSVIILCHNYANYLPEAVASVRQQTYRSFEIILVDDGSTDDSPAVAQRLAAEMPPDIHCRILRLDDVGPTAARRSGIAQARGKYFLPLDADDRIAPDFLAKTVPLLEADAKAGFAYVDTVFFGDKELRHHQPEYDFARLCQGNFISHTSLIRKAAFDEVSGYDPENWGYYEDWDLWLRLGDKGWFGKHLAEPLFFYRHHFNSSLSLFAGRLDPLYKAFLQSRHPGLYPPEVVASARQALAEMPPGWNLQPPMRDIGQLKSLLTQHPRNRHVMYFLGCALMKDGARAEAETILRNLLSLYPDDVQARELLKQMASAPSSPGPAGSNPLVSVIVPTYNRPDWLGETLKSILAQTYREFEIIVVNDAGSDVSHLIEPLNADGRIRLVTHDKNRGLAGARNTGVRNARGQYIAYLDDDDIFHPHHLAALVGHLQATGAAVVYSDAHRGTQRRQDGRYVVVERTVPYSHDWDRDKILVHNFVPVLCFLHLKECVEKAGWFDESLTTHEDWDLWMRMSRLFEFSHLKQVTCEFRWRDDGSSMSSERQADFVRTAKIIYAKHPEFVANRPDLEARRQQFLVELSRPPARPESHLVPVSVVIPVFNKVEFTRQCLARLAANACAVPHEIIVVDDGSTDETESFCRAQLERQPNLRYYRLPRNSGFGRACNHGAAQAHGRWVVFLNNDTEPEAGWLEAAVARLQSDPTIGILGAKLLYPNRTVQHCGVEFVWADNPDHKIWPLHRHMGVPEHDPRANLEGQVAAVTGACLFIERALFDQIGGFSPEYPMYFEDADLCFKVWQARRIVFYEPKCVVIHHESQSSPNRERVDALNQESGEIFFKKWPGALAKIAFDTCLEKSDGRFNYFRPEVLSTAGRFLKANELEVIAKSLVQLFHEAGPFYMHFGGAGDALLLLATFLDQHPDAQVISFSNSIPAMRSFFEAFPSLKRVWFLPKNGNPQFHIILRMMMRHVKNCLGMGTTPEGDYFKDWHAGLDIFEQMKVSRRPDWPAKFRVNPRPKQVVLAPQGSLCGMVGSKRNIIDPAVWPQLIQFILNQGFQPVVIGTPEESKSYPCLAGCEDRRSHSFHEQMEHIANSVMLIGADSWAKTFSALAGIPTIVFEPIKGADWSGKKDPSDFIFLDPWDSITVVKNLEQCRQVFAKLIAAAAPSESTGPSLVPAGSVIAWEGSFLDFGSLSHVNRELTRELAGNGDVRIQCVNTATLPNGAPVPGELKNLADTLAKTSPAHAQVTVRHAWPPNWKRPATGKLVVIQPWEFGSLPQDWVRRARDVDEFWLPSNYVRRVYLDSGVPAEKVWVVPNGVDPEKFHPQAAPMKLATQKKFKFLFVGGTIGRKGPDLLLQAYLKNFTAADDVCLVIKDFGGRNVYQGQTFEHQIRAVQANPNAPEILYLNEELPPAALPGLYTACDCFVMPYRGEGFGLPVLEAMACGLPVIVTAGGATDDFVRDEFAYRIPSARRGIGHEVSGMKLVGEGWLLEPDLAALAGRMRHVVDHPAEARERGQLASRHVGRNFSWKNSAAVIAGRIRTLASSPDETVRPVVEPRPFQVPGVAQVGQLAEARELFGQKKFPAAWEAAVMAITHRPFHPEALLLLAEIALAAGDANSARQCAQRARDLAPGWNAPKQFLRKSLKGSAKLEWLKLPPAVGNRLTVCLITRNEEKFLPQCLLSVRDLAQQIIVVDTGSTDRTVEIAREFNAEIHSHPWNDDFSAARNAALEHATGDWVLMLDADEELPAAQHGRLTADLKKSDAIAYRLPLANAGQENQGHSFVPRLYRNAPGIFYRGRIHEQVFPSLLPLGKAWGLKTALGTAEILHHGYTKDMVRDRNKVERNLKLLRLAIAESPSDANLMMNLGLELVRSDDLAAGIEQYRAAYALMSAQPPAEVVPELREALLTQFTSQLYKLPAYAEVVAVLNSPLAQKDGLTASLHFSLGLAYFESKQFSEAADQMRQCTAKRKQRALSPINTDIHTAAPQHCLALSLTRLGDHAGAEKAFRAALAEPKGAEDVDVDYARFLAETGREIEALQKLNEIVAQNSGHVAAWCAGGKIALAKRDYLEFARDWTGEASKALPENRVILAQRAEALMLNNDIAGAVELWEKLWDAGRSPAVLAALILCEAVEKPTTHAPDEGADELLTSREFINWYQRLLKLQLRPLLERVNERLEKLGRALPTAARMIEGALAEPADILPK